MTQKELRKKYKQVRAEIKGDLRKEADKKIADCFLNSYMCKKAEWILPFVSYGTEVDTVFIIKKLLADGDKHVAVPRVQGQIMEFYEIKSMDDLTPGYMGIPEPEGDCPVDISEGIIILPGLCFDLKFNRIGYGGGFYDKYLAAHPELTAVALAYSPQLLKGEFIPAEPHDRKADYIITENGIMSEKHN